MRAVIPSYALASAESPGHRADDEAAYRGDALSDASPHDSVGQFVSASRGPTRPAAPPSRSRLGASPSGLTRPRRRRVDPFRAVASRSPLPRFESAGAWGYEFVNFNPSRLGAAFRSLSGLPLEPLEVRFVRGNVGTFREKPGPFSPCP